MCVRTGGRVCVGGGGVCVGVGVCVSASSAVVCTYSKIRYWYTHHDQHLAIVELSTTRRAQGYKLDYITSSVKSKTLLHFYSSDQIILWLRTRLAKWKQGRI